jgi:hypothetical protein
MISKEYLHAGKTHYKLYHGYNFTSILELLVITIIRYKLYINIVVDLQFGLLINQILLTELNL